MSFDTRTHAPTRLNASTIHRWVGLKGAARSIRPGRRKHVSEASARGSKDGAAVFRHHENLRFSDDSKPRTVERAGAFEFHTAVSDSAVAAVSGDTQ